MGEELSSKSVYFPTISRWLLKKNLSFLIMPTCVCIESSDEFWWDVHICISVHKTSTHTQWVSFFFSLSLNTPMANGVWQWWCTNTLNCLEIRYNLSRGDSDETKKMNDNVILTLAASNSTGSAHGQEHSCAWRSHKKSLRAAIFLLIIM